MLGERTSARHDHEHSDTGLPGAMRPGRVHALLHRPWFSAVHGLIVDEIRPVAGEMIVDVGCGDGQLVRRLARRGAVVVGADPDERAIRTAIASGTSSTTAFVVAAAEELPFWSGSVDAVATSVSAHHWSDIDRGLREVARILRPGGRFVLAELRPPTRIDMLTRRLGSPSHRGARDADDWRTMLEDAGFVDVDVVRRGVGARLVLALTARRRSSPQLGG